jgi:hypothetical protein
MSQATPLNDKIHFCYYVVALIDVLGQCEKLKSLTEIPKTPEKIQEFNKVVKETFGTIECLREQFRNSFETHRSPSRLPEEQLKNHPAGIVDEFMARELRLGEVYFSDTFLFHAPVYRVGAHLSINEVYAMITASGAIMQAALAGEVALRGGIDIGIAAELRPNDLYGRALCQVEYLEKHVALYPRIVVGKELRDFIEGEASIVGTDLPGMVYTLMARSCMDLIPFDFDGIPFVDFLGPVMRRIAGKIDSGHQQMIQDGLAFVVREHERFKNNSMHSEGDRKLAQRYALLRGYYQSKIGLWT